ncbi:phosphomannose isomerase type II C-terminal cupin domain [Thiotrichales bacterium 19X7-9]|nr:phosphomannose isomerase type II C-terminal cupin domain [Thiotrichales bacterium 19X7-9]
MSDINEIGKTYHRPWGTYQTLALANGYQVKTITVNPGGILSLQKHFKRAEHWVVVKGNPTFTIGDDKKTYQVNDHVYIQKEQIHRMENHTDTPCEIIEVQIGHYLGEDDIVRIEDVYNR